jgi:hypothetical protein
MAERTIFARALPEAVRITETYSYQQTVDRNPSHDFVGDPKGELKVTVAYDGQRSFARQAWLDVRHQKATQRKNGQDRLALTGHLAFANTGRTRLGEVLDLRGQFNTVPIPVPVAHSILEQSNSLVDGRHAWEAKIEYSAEEPDAWPIRLTLKLRDEKSPGGDLEASETHSPSLSTQDLAATIARHLASPRELTLLVQVRVDLPAYAADDSQPPVISKVRVGWPRFTALHGFRLAQEDKPGAALDYRFDPNSRSVTWGKITMMPARRTSVSGMRTFHSPLMALTIEQPSDLYVETPSHLSPGGLNDADPAAQSEVLAGEVEVEVPNRLLSGLQVRLFDGTGRLVDKPPLHLKTLLKCSFSLNLDDIFAQRPVSPRQRLVFDQVIPNDLRLLDVKTALADRGFQVEDKGRVNLPGSDFAHLLVAERPEGQEKLILQLVLEGRSHTTRRETQIPGRQRYTSTFESGELTIHVAGRLAGDSKALMREMNTLQQALRTRFDRLRANR